MSIQTDLNVSPYFDDYKETNDYYKILFRPGVAVQTRELNQLQTMLQKQIERFGDNVFKRGAVIDGCDITYHSTFPYVKIKDTESDGAPVNVAQYVGYHVRNQANVYPVVGVVTTVTSGFESRNPDLNTLYVKYLNSGFANVGGVLTEQQTFAANQTLTVYNPANIIEKVVTYDTSSGFANTDTVVFLSAIAIQNSTGGTAFANNFYVGDIVGDGTASAEVIEIDSNTRSDSVILRMKPRAVDLKAANSELWSFAVNTNIQSSNTTPSSVANVVAIIGTGAAGSLKTGTLGEVDSISITSRGSGYYVLPTVSIASPDATTGQIAEANLVAQNYLTTVVVADESTAPIGTGYAVTVGDGVIYQKGYFSRVNEHLVVVEKYNNVPDGVTIGFDTGEQIINYNQDQSLLDNATGSPNATAPGANRLKLTPKLITKSLTDARANTDFLSIVEFSEGNPYKQSRQTVYNIVGTEMARRTYEESGNYVLDEFVMATKAPFANSTQSSFQREATSFGITVDPGLAYINGSRVETTRTYATIADKGTDTYVVNNAIISLNYGNYIRIKEVGGTFLFKTGDIVNLYGTAKNYLSTGAGGAITSSGLGQLIGTARIRSITHESGTPGTPMAVYRLYLFDIRLGTARNLTLVRSVFYDGSTKGIADTVLENGVTVLKDNNTSSLLYYGGNPAIKNANNISYVYRTVNTYTLATNGIISFSATGGESFPYTGTLSTTQERDIIIVPLANCQLSANISGSVSCNTTSTQVNGTSTSFATELQAGDFLKINGTVIGQIDSVANNNALFLAANASGTVASGNAVVYLPQNVPLPLERSTRSVNVNAAANTLTINLGNTINVATSVAVSFNVRSSNTAPVTKTVNRNRFVRIAVANNTAGAEGPWTLGVPDVFRLGKVYRGSNATFLDTDTSGVVDVTQNFYVDHNQSEDYYGISYLYMNPKSKIALSDTDYLLVKFDHFTDAGEGLKGPGSSGSYLINDTQPLSNSATTINTLEIPEVYGTKGTYYDLRDHFDFRPQSANTIAANSNPANAPINPVEPTDTARFSVTDKKFPAPDSFLTGTIEYYQGRVDRVTIDSSGKFHVVKGTPGIYEVPPQPVNALTINTLTIPPYPSLPTQLTAQTVQFIDTKIANEKFTNARSSKFRVTTNIDKTQRTTLQPRGYTMADIGKLEQRVKTLEYYASLSLAESNVQKRVIPSSGNASTDRFKFGFFVDSFDNYAYSDKKNPGYNATVINGMLSPAVEEVNLPITLPKRQVSLPFEEVEFVVQSTATDGPVYVAPVIVPSTPTTTPVYTAPVTEPGPVVEPDTGTWYFPPPSTPGPPPPPAPTPTYSKYTYSELRRAAEALYYTTHGGWPSVWYEEAAYPWNGDVSALHRTLGWDGTLEGAEAIAQAYGIPLVPIDPNTVPDVLGIYVISEAPPIVAEEPATGYTNQEQPQTFENYDSFGYLDDYNPSELPVNMDYSGYAYGQFGGIKMKDIWWYTNLV